MSSLHFAFAFAFRVLAISFVVVVVVVVIDGWSSSTAAAAATAHAASDDVIFPNARRRPEASQSNVHRCDASSSSSSSPSCQQQRQQQRQQQQQQQQQNSMPLSLAKELSEVADAQHFLQRYVENGPAVYLGAPSVQPRAPFANAPIRGKVPAQATCRPEMRTVSVRDTNDPTLYYYPNCIRVNRCGGCCAHELLECQPNSWSNQSVTIYVSKYVGKRTLQYVGAKTLVVVQHEQCACDCKIKAADCRGRQEYRKDDCRCACRNDDEEGDCTQLRNKLWNPTSCRCECRETLECSSGYYFDAGRCGCVSAERAADLGYEPSFYRSR